MLTGKQFLYPAVIALALVCVSCGGGSRGDPSVSSGNSEGEDQFEVSLVRVTDLEAASRSVFSNIGNDPLAQGRVEVEELGGKEVEISVQGAATNTTYNTSFCPFAGGMGGCFAVTSFMTDNRGNAEVEVVFPQTGTFAGIFLLQSGGMNQFVTGFAVPASEHTSSTSSSEDENENESEEQEFEAQLQPAGMVSGGLGFGTAGSDALVAGRVGVENQVKIELTGAAMNALYQAKFCRFGLDASNCIAVGSVPTDAQGNAQVELGFPAMGHFDGVFVLTRTVNGQELNEFVTSFRIL
jgi:hypothetical protein